MTTLPEFDQIVAGVLHLEKRETGSGTAWCDGYGGRAGYKWRLASDWNALMAAVKSLEEKGWYFEREDMEWHVYHGSQRDVPRRYFRFADAPAREQECLALCIKAAVEHTT